MSYCGKITFMSFQSNSISSNQQNVPNYLNQVKKKIIYLIKLNKPHGYFQKD